MSIGYKIHDDGSTVYSILCTGYKEENGVATGYRIADNNSTGYERGCVYWVLDPP